MAPNTRTSSAGGGRGMPATAEELAQLISQHVNTALEQHDANLSAGRGRGRGATGGSSGGGGGIGSPTGGQVIGCTYKTFQVCHPRIFTGAEGPLDIVRWIEKMESVITISNCSDDQKVKYATCTFHSG